MTDTPRTCARCGERDAVAVRRLATPRTAIKRPFPVCALCLAYLDHTSNRDPAGEAVQYAPPHRPPPPGLDAIEGSMGRTTLGRFGDADRRQAASGTGRSKGWTARERKRGFTIGGDE